MKITPSPSPFLRSPSPTCLHYWAVSKVFYTNNHCTGRTWMYLNSTVLCSLHSPLSQHKHPYTIRGGLTTFVCSISPGQHPSRHWEEAWGTWLLVTVGSIGSDAGAVLQGATDHGLVPYWKRLFVLPHAVPARDLIRTANRPKLGYRGVSHPFGNPRGKVFTLYR